MRAELAYYIDLHRSRLRDLAWTTLLFLLQPLVLVIALLKIREIFDLAVNGEDHGALIWLGLSIIGLYVFSMTLSLLVRRRMLIITRGIIRELRQDIFSALYSYSRAAYTQFDRKRLQTMLVQDVIRVDVMSNAVAGQLLPNALICLAIVTVLLYLNSLLFLLTIILIPTLAIILSLARPKIKRLVKRYHGQLESVQNQTLFNLEAIDLTHAQGAEAAELQRQDETGLWFRKTTDKLTLLREFLSVLQDTVMLTVSIGCLIGGAWLIREEAMSVGELVAFYAALMLLRPHLSTLWRSLPLALEGIESFRKLYAWINLDDPAPSFGSQTPNVNGDISFDNVAFDYPGKPLLADVSFTVQPGGKVAIYGDNGSGKSTLTYLLLGFYQPVSGAIRIDGTPLADLDIRLFREKIGIVPQNPYIFQGTIWENITYGVDHPLAEAVERACHYSQADQFLSTLPLGYDTRIGDDGVLLSGGQIQRIALARALLNQPDFLLMDEPTNHLDHEAINEFFQRLSDSDYHPTCLIITHEAEILDYVDSAYLLEDGQLTPIDNKANNESA